MTMATLAEVLTPCLRDGTSVAGLVVLGWEDALAFVRAAEAEGRPVILQAGPGCRAHMPLTVLGAMFRALGEAASVPVVAHLDHGESIAICQAAIDCGFTSVMYDGSALPLAENIALTRQVVEMAHRQSVSVEAELGVVGYHNGAVSTGTNPDEVAIFARETGVDALAVSVGNVHLMTETGAVVDQDRLHAIEAAAPNLPLVLHGGSGISPNQRRHLAQQTTVCKFNIGTELRMVFGQSLRASLDRDPNRFDRNQILKDTVDPMITLARQIIRNLA